jgi:D-proline reductase (dithiol) PrdB
MTLSRIKNIVIAKVITRFPSLAKKFVESYKPWESEDIPWTPMTRPLHECTLALITTAGVHLKSQTPFDMVDSNGDPTFRKIESTTAVNDLMITHDYYNHADADKDMNIVFPITRLREFVEEGVIGSLASKFYSFMGHIDGPHIPTLIHKSTPDVIKGLKTDKVDVVLLIPG